MFNRTLEEQIAYEANVAKIKKGLAGNKMPGVKKPGRPEPPVQTKGAEF